ncbi:hypothetical protein RhiirC2_853462 [Rhizophagus irregularis]|uniref:Protein kinase domain-containing protein n=1 Tax=Rhizophagus irregularis TaxID=588596 RepID=A0A2N1MVG0_9GLOM|nr:hypothetical protein RhiirC2_853462 [Rhizophagus irregularis]
MIFISDPNYFGLLIFNSTKWVEKLRILQNIAEGLAYIHENGLIHRDFHCGNILKEENYALITDLGLCRPANVKPSQNECKELYGVLPYVAPEVLRGKEYTQESDIYGFGIIAYEICTGLPPYHDIVHDKFLAISICQGLRPKSNYKIPQLILNIIKQCWDADPLKRPKADELQELLYNLCYESQTTEIKKQIEEADKINEKLISSSSLYTGPTLSYTTNPQAVYTSRLLDFKNLPKPKNSIDNKDDDDSFGEYSESIEAIDFTKLNLVNRLWCRLAIPLLWENPFSITTGNYNFIEVYLYNLNDYLKTKINNYQIINNLLPSNTLFNYPSFIKYLNMCNITLSIERWLEANNKTSNSAVSKFKRLININLNLSIVNNHCKSMLIKNRISQIINLHQNLKRILFGNNTNLSLYQSLLLSKEFNCSNTLNTIIFYYINFKDINNLVKVFDNLNVLESVHIIYCNSLGSFIQQITNLTKPLKLKSLFMLMALQIDLLQSLLQKYGNYLENFKCGSYGFVQQRHLELIMKYCKNIKFLDLCGIKRHITSLIFDLIENIKQNLNYLSINVGYCQNELILRNLGLILPSKLEYLSLALRMINTNNFEVFLKDSQDNFFKKLLINNLMRGYSDDIDILPYIKEYIMKKERVQYLTIKNTLYNRADVDLSNFKDEVNEFKLHNIKVLKYDNLSTDIYRFVNEID